MSVAVGARIDFSIDLNDIAGGDGYLFVRDGVGFAGTGVAFETTAVDAHSALGRIETTTGAHPIAFGAIPFVSDPRARFVVPSIVVEKLGDGTTLVTAVAGDHASATKSLESAISDMRAVPHSRPVTAGSFSVSPLVAVDTYLAAVAAARDAVRGGHLTKAVIARDIRVTSDAPIDIHSVLLRLKASFGSSYRYSFDNLIGASPELLVAVEDGTIRSHPLAGTTARTGDPATDARLATDLVSSTKNQIEHRVVVDTVHDTLLPFCSYLDWEAEPSVVPVANVQHLGTRVEGKLNREVTSTELALLLSPTPALGGHPRDAALQLIAAHEGMDRGLYGGAIGWCDAKGNGTFAVTIRCAQFNETRTAARLFAGGGIVADSEPLAELAETQAKFQAMLSAIIRP
jgi:isochorismate synthase